jgi:hypothetical protein
MLTKYSIVCQVSGAEPYTVGPYSGADLSRVLGITQADMPDGYYAWIQECGEVAITVSGKIQYAYADFSPNASKFHLSGESSGNSGQKTSQNQGLKTRQCEEWACLSGFGD